MRQGSPAPRAAASWTAGCAGAPVPCAAPCARDLITIVIKSRAVPCSQSCAARRLHAPHLALWGPAARGAAPSAPSLSAARSPEVRTRPGRGRPAGAAPLRSARAVANVTALRVNRKGTYMWFDTQEVVITSGTGTGSSEIAAFDAALRAAGIANFNLILVSSIVPPGIRVRELPPGTPAIGGKGSMLPAVYARVGSSRAGEVVSAAVGVGEPADTDECGVIFINGGRDLGEEQCVADLAQMVAEGMSKVRGTDAYDFRCRSASATVAADGTWTVVVAALCFADQSLWQYFRPVLGDEQPDRG
jgi:arginine decarboxylase